MQNQKFGIEIEMTGLTRQKAAEVIANYFNSYSHYDGGGYKAYSVMDNQDRIWKIMYDSSITAECRARYADDEYKVEVVSPICEYKDIKLIQEIVRQLRHAGAISNSSCGIHIHVDASNHHVRSLKNIVNIIASKEDLLYKSLKVRPGREEDYCQKMDTAFLNRFNNSPPKTLEQIKSLWYNGRDGSHSHYHDSRYHGLNLHSVFQKGTIEFRLFNSDIHHAGKIKAYIQLSLAISHQALVQRRASQTRTRSTNEKYTFRTWLLRLGMIGDEFKTARKHLLDTLDGCIAWKNPEDAVRQRERIREQNQLSDQFDNQDTELQETNHRDNNEQEETPAFSMSM